MALSSRSLITKTGINTTQVFDMGGINISGGDFNLGSTIKLGNASGIITATSFSGAFASTKLSVSGISTFQNNVHLLDNDKLQIGGSVGTVDGLELYHDGSYSYISETGTGGLIIDAPNTIFQDGKKVVLGTDSDVQLYHDNSHGYISNSTGNLRINSDALRLRSLTGSENYLKADVNGTVELYHNNVKTFQTSTHGCQIFAPEGGSAQVYIYADEGDDNADLWGFIASHTASKFSLVNYASGSYEDSIVANGDGSVELYHDDTKRLETSSNGLTVTGRVDPAADSTHDLGTTSVRWRNLYADTLYGDGSNLTGISAGTSLSGSTNDTICTVTGANAITGEANLTFNGTNLLTVHVPSATGEPAINFTNSDTGTGTGNGFGIGINDAESPYIYNRENTAIRIATNNTERFRIHADGKVTIAGGTTAQETSTGLLLLDKNLTAESDVSDENNYHLVIRSQTNSNTSKLGIAFANTTDDTHVGAAILHHRTSTDSIGDLAFYTSPSSGTTTEGFRIDKDGKLYKGGNQFYPLVNYVEVASFSNSSTSSTSYVDLRTIYSGYTPKKAGNRIVIHHQSQMWNGTDANSNGDVFWRLQRQEGGGSWTNTIVNERILGNHDGHSYTGGSGLARHHRTVHLMGSFICAGTTINLKTQGKSVSGISWDWYHDSNNILQIWEYELN